MIQKQDFALVEIIMSFLSPKIQNVWHTMLQSMWKNKVQLIINCCFLFSETVWDGITQKPFITSLNNWMIWENIQKITYCYIDSKGVRKHLNLGPFESIQ